MIDNGYGDGESDSGIWMKAKKTVANHEQWTGLSIKHELSSPLAVILGDILC